MSLQKWALASILKLVLTTLSMISDAIFKWIYIGKRRTLPPINNPILLETATSLAEKIRTKKIKSRDVVQAFIDRINAINPILNCVVDNRFEDALKDADKVDELINGGSLPIEEMVKDKPFLGVPFSTKDSLAIKGLCWTAGLVARKDVKAEKDSDAVTMMREAGAIPLALTNVSELCLWWESSNNVHGQTNNPYDTTRIVGGSSGGEGCLISASGIPFGIGSDVGGSIRLPSFFNGIFGHKPSKGVVSNGGQFPQAGRTSAEILLTGPMCRYTSDLLPMLKCLGGSNVPNQVVNNKVELKKLKIYYMEDDCGVPLTISIEDEMKHAFNKVITHFKNTVKVTPIKVNFKNVVHVMEMWSTQMMSPNEPLFSEIMAECNGKINPWIEFLKWIVRRSDHTLPAISLAITEKVTSALSKQGEERTFFINMLEELKTDFRDMLADDGIFLYPSQPRVAPYHNQPIFQPFSFLYTALFNALQLPVTQCPLGLTENGLPLGIQVVANSHNDHLCLAVAGELEKAFGGWVNPSVVL